jgi:hypothetical protein
MTRKKVFNLGPQKFVRRPGASSRGKYLELPHPPIKLEGEESKEKPEETVKSK